MISSVEMQENPSSGQVHQLSAKSMTTNTSKMINSHVRCDAGPRLKEIAAL